MLRVRRQGKPDIFVGRRFGNFVQLHKRLRTELPGKVLPPLPRKNKNSVSTFLGGADDDASSVSSVSTDVTADANGSTRNPAPLNTFSNSSTASLAHVDSPRASGELKSEHVMLYREQQRVSLRAFLRLLLQNERIASSKAMEEFLTADPVTLNEEEQIDIQRRKDLDAKRIEEQKQFYEIARKRAQELDVYMEQFRQDIVESSKRISLVL